VKYLFLLLLSWGVWAQELKLPDLNRPVIDLAGLLTASQVQDLGNNIRELHEGGGPQVGIFIADELQGFAVEDFSIRLAEKWQLGKAKNDNGLIILVAVKERKMRIEVGGGIEGDVTDLEASRWIQNILTPSFRSQNYAGGLKTVLFEVAKKFDITLSGKPLARRVRRSGRELSPISSLVIVVLFFVIFPLINRMRGGSRGFSGGYGGGGWSSGGGSSWSSGGGSSWGGGGGGFSGGGASGDW
jgi:uncharacterized protein